MSPPPTNLIADRALDWIEANLDCFEPLHGSAKPDEVRQKAVVELALLCMYLRRRPRYANDHRVARSLEFLLRLSRTPFFSEALFRVPTLFVPHLLLAVALHNCGYDTLGSRWPAIQKLVDASNVTWTERPSHRTLELRLLLDLGGFSYRLPSMADLHGSSILATPLNVIYATDGDAYAITHALFYLSDFGHQPIAFPSNADEERSLLVVEELLGMYLHCGNWDLVGELLLSCYCLRRTTFDLYTLGWQALLNEQWADGSMPGPHLDRRQADGLEGAKRRSYLFEQSYHTTLVAALAGGLCPPRSQGDRR
jgi:hypothetical protein